MTVTVKPLSRSLREWLDFADPEALTAGFEWDPSVYESMPRSITNPELVQSWTCIGGWTGWCNGIDVDYMASGGDGENDEYFMYAVPVGGTFPDDMVLVFYDMAEAAWTHVHVDLAYGDWNILFGVVQNSETPLRLWMDNIEFTPALVLYAPQSGPYYQHIDFGTLTLTPKTPLCAARTLVPTGELSLTGFMPNFGPTGAFIPAGVLTLTGRNPASIWSIPLPLLFGSKMIYTLTLTGAPDGVADLIIPMSSLQSIVRNGDPSYLSCVIPNSFYWADGIMARPNGELIVKKGYLLADGTVMMEEIIRVNFETIRIDHGARNDSATLVGHKTVTATAPKDWTVSGVSYYALDADGKRRFRAAMDLFLRPGDTAYYGTEDADNFIVGEINYIVSAGSAVMEVTEA
jgi:hypothetical protein